MTPFLQMLLWTTAAGVCMPIGAALARIERIRPQWLEDEFRHTLIAIGGGLLLGAVALVLVPEGVGRITSPVAAAALLLAGGVAYMAFDRAQAKQQRSTPQFAAMASDLVPECLALGGMFAANAEGAVLLAVLIGLQSLPEAFNAWRELATDDLSVRTAFAMMAAIGAPRPPLRVGRLVLACRPALHPGFGHAARGRRNPSISRSRTSLPRRGSNDIGRRP